MYINYGDKDFFEYGCLVDSEHSDTVFDMLLCRPYDVEDDLCQFAHVQVDTEDSWIDRKAVMDFVGMDSQHFNRILFAIGCVDYYDWANFGADSYGVSYNWQRMTKADICKELNGYLIVNDNLDIVWK